MGKINVHQLGKAYKQYPSRWARLAEWVLPGSTPRHTLKWVMKEVSFTVPAGQALGVIGINGAGKSTLLKMITGTTQPTTGSVSITGRVAALLELGMGFHPEFTGRQNALMAGQLLGYTKEDITRLMPAIEAFAEIGDYIDQPVRVYSSGMQMRLAFSVATAQRPDVLIVDEALSVGDAYFQHKSFDRIREFRKHGTTLLIVSHDKQAIQSICDRAILLNAGELAMEGEPEAVMDYYNAILADIQAKNVQQSIADDGKLQTKSGTGQASLLSISLNDLDGQAVEVIDVSSPVELVVKVKANSDIPTLIFGYLIKDRLGQPVYGLNTSDSGNIVRNVKLGDRWEYHIKFSTNLGPGSYSIAIALTPSESHATENYEWIDRALLFTVVNQSKNNFAGCAWLDAKLTVERPLS
jgi:lipopolysaccharide transport system ATP-binding protein